MEQTKLPPKKLCTNCILPSTFPGISFNEQGVCNHCQRYKGKKITSTQQKKYEDKFLKLIKEKRQNHEYEVIVAYSGGKDSTYTLDLFVNRYKLKVLAATLDNSFISPKALDNIATVCANLKVDNILLRPNPTMMRQIFGVASQQEIFFTKNPGTGQLYLHQLHYLC